MEVCQVQGVTGELLSVELHEERVVLLGELPHDFVGDSHFYLCKMSFILPYLLMDASP